MNDNHVEWIMRWGIWGTFLGHGLWALTIKQGWFGYFTGIGIAEATIPTILILIGLMDVTVAFTVLIKPYKFVLGWAVLWGITTALIRPITGGFFTVEFLDFVERFANFMLPLALLAWHGWPHSVKEWFSA